MVKKYVPDRADIVWVDLDPTKGHEQARLRPALVLSPSKYNQASGLMIACAITTKSKGYPFEVMLKGKKVEGVILADQIRTLDWKERKASFLQKADESILSEVIEKLNVLIGD
jgi:mRNA interferase MazF